MATSPYSPGLRWLHYGILSFVLALALTGYSIYLREPLGLGTLKRPLVYIHAVTAYAFLSLLLVRIVGAGLAPNTLSLRRALPRPQDLTSIATGKVKPSFVGRSSLSRILSATLYIAFVVMGLTGLVRAGTDIYFLPFGPLAQSYLAAPGTLPHTLQPFEAAGADPGHWHRLMVGKGLVGKVHIYCGFLILAVALCHGLGAFLTAWRGRDTQRSGPARWMLLGRPKEDEVTPNDGQTR